MTIGAVGRDIIETERKMEEKDSLKRQGPVPGFRVERCPSRLVQEDPTLFEFQRVCPD
jgi:hypothetical protein